MDRLLTAAARQLGRGDSDSPSRTLCLRRIRRSGRPPAPGVQGKRPNDRLDGAGDSLKTMPWGAILSRPPMDRQGGRCLAGPRKHATQQWLCTMATYQQHIAICPRWVHYLALLTVCATLPLLTLGAEVTTRGV